MDQTSGKNHFVRKQHYYPRSLLQYFSGEKNKVFAYLVQENKIISTKPENLCFRRDTYESTDVVDNVLERKLSVYEARVGGIVKYILENIGTRKLVITLEEKNALCQYLFLQFLRTDSGRINFITTFENLYNSNFRRRPIETTEIRDNRDKIDKFNRIFKNQDSLEDILQLFTQSMDGHLRIAITEKNLLTSDNPVIVTDEWRQMIMPISPNICIEYQHKTLVSSANLVTLLSSEKVKYLNEATINTANYCVISTRPFDFEMSNYIYNRFNNKNWDFSTSHFPKL